MPPTARCRPALPTAAAVRRERRRRRGQGCRVGHQLQKNHLRHRVALPALTRATWTTRPASFHI